MFSFVGEKQLEKLRTTVENFNKAGYCVLDEFFETSIVQKLHSEITQLQAANLMKPNQVQFLVEGKTLLVTKPGIFEADLFDKTLRSFEPLETFRDVYGKYGEEFVTALQANGYSKSLVAGENGRVVKLQYNDGNGGCFPLHYDNPGRPNKRVVTCAIYLNPDWKEGDGGELELVPFLASPVIIPPKMNRLVIFRSDSILHRVLPTNAKRYCFTIWIDGKNVNSDSDTQLRIRKDELQDVSALSSNFRNSAVQRLLARAVYRENFEISLRECMKETPGFKILLAQHLGHLESVKKNKALYQLVETLRQYKESERCNSG
uniref:Fe2OG dioxygenase domain-containing protein n=1 Tax=Aplanochytrium stocchinoi TaxID=215587 RepID=A0A7S3LII3_9STRA|mmetsp:Transcript_7222/g.9148  ORF Transcript_7222/g.9148 Transcript_7222/m.9148 type:complete len:318 (-) Transcript_7222:414-1367(-)|eukprot:CAMPEP_0204826438 /NCGR_PEP_ID=MMETSP1346-20131115/4134_1 /ASSEMBLY_ACC=CAM_ASM_000771 /TAXON_ID=215587 /ORGANISM="Aplanochytrium stocchinoi, Strain GSBS06" /LENGTH=317 /DNA_ID=CAMNT_0051954471 /DNA_START=96 /DNA_END=1049 /DNA_ORIENTATION=-